MWLSVTPFRTCRQPRAAQNLSLKQLIGASLYLFRVFFDVFFSYSASEENLYQIGCREKAAVFDSIVRLIHFHFCSTPSSFQSLTFTHRQLL